MRSPPTFRNANSTSGDDPMTFVILRKRDHYVIVNDDADFIAGNVYPTTGKKVRIG
jgi:hypothetical protein